MNDRTSMAGRKHLHINLRRAYRMVDSVEKGVSSTWGSARRRFKRSRRVKTKEEIKLR